jgi:hypothetical protein
MNVLVRELGVTHVVVGEDFRFGKGRGGDTTVLAYMGEMEGFGVTVFRAVVEDDEKISSSKVRAALKAGRPDEAARLLGHTWSVEGHVAHGDKRGRTLGFPTANLKLEHTLHPAFGVYAVRAHRAAEERTYAASQISASGRCLKFPRRCSRCTSSTSTATSTANCCTWNSFPTCAENRTSPTSTRCKRKWRKTPKTPAESYPTSPLPWWERAARRVRKHATGARATVI